MSQHRAAVQAAVDAGVKHVVYTSGPAPHPTPKGSLINDHYWTEQALAASPLEWTILRHHIYTDFLVGTLATALKFGVLSGSAGDGGNNVRDARRLRTRRCGRARRRFQRPPNPRCHGPRAQSRAPSSRALRATLRASRCGIRAVSRAEHEKMLAGRRAAAVPRRRASVDFDEAQSQGHLAIRSPAVQELTGKAPQSVADFLTSAARGVDARELAAASRPRAASRAR